MIPETSVYFWQYFDAVSLIAIAVVIAWIVIRFRRKNDSPLKTISHTVAHSSRSSLIYSITMTIFFPLYYAFIWFWVGPTAGVPPIFYYLLAISAICEMIFVWVPARQGMSGRIHAAAAGFVGVTMFLLGAILALRGSNISFPGFTSSIIFLLTTFGLILLLFTKKYQRQLFLFEIIYCIAFLAMMSAIAHF